MSQNKVTLSQLRVLEALLRTRSFSNAADELGISQPSVSNQIRAFEHACKVPLIIRNGHTIRPTPLAEALLGKARAVVSLSQDMEQIIQGQTDLQTGSLRIGYSAYQYAIPIISRFAQSYPGIKIEAISKASMDIIDAMKNARIDIAIVTSQAPPEKFYSEKIADTRIVLMVPLSHPLAGQEEVEWGALKGVKILRRETGSVTRQIFDAAAARAGLSLDHVVDLGSWGALRTAVESGLGACIALRCEIEPRDAVSVVNIRDDTLFAAQYIVTRPDLRYATSISTFFDVARKGAASAQPSQHPR